MRCAYIPNSFESLIFGYKSSSDLIHDAIDKALPNQGTNFIQKKAIEMIIDFIIYISTKIFKSYLSGVAFLAGILTLTSIALIKFIIIKFYPQIGHNATWRGVFQLSYLCYIPVVLLLIFKKIGYRSLTNNVFEKNGVNYFWSLLSVLLLCGILAILFTYILVVW